MSNVSLFSKKEKIIGAAGFLALVAGVAVPTYMSKEHLTTFIASVGAIGQVGVALALFVVTCAQWKLQTQTVQADKARLLRDDERREREEKRQADDFAKRLKITKGELRESIEGFFRSYDPDTREQYFEVFSNRLADLKPYIDDEPRNTIAPLLRQTNRILANSLAGKSEENGRFMGSWCADANRFLRMIGEAEIAWKNSKP